jgi:hypothetical protein
MQAVVRTFVKQTQGWIQWFIKVLEKEWFTMHTIYRDMFFAISSISLGHNPTEKNRPFYVNKGLLLRPYRFKSFGLNLPLR